MNDIPAADYVLGSLMFNPVNNFLFEVLLLDYFSLSFSKAARKLVW